MARAGVVDRVIDRLVIDGVFCVHAPEISPRTALRRSTLRPRYRHSSRLSASREISALLASGDIQRKKRREPGSSSEPSGVASAQALRLEVVDAPKPSKLTKVTES